MREKSKVLGNLTNTTWAACRSRPKVSVSPKARGSPKIPLFDVTVARLRASRDTDMKDRFSGKSGSWLRTSMTFLLVIMGKVKERKQRKEQDSLRDGSLSKLELKPNAMAGVEDFPSSELLDDVTFSVSESRQLHAYFSWLREQSLF